MRTYHIVTHPEHPGLMSIQLGIVSFVARRHPEGVYRVKHWGDGRRWALLELNPSDAEPRYRTHIGEYLQLDVPQDDITAAMQGNATPLATSAERALSRAVETLKRERAYEERERRERDAAYVRRF